MSDKHSVKNQGIRFVISGGISAVVDLGLTYILQIFFGQTPRVSRLVGFIFGTLTAYMINRRWTFEATPSVSRFIYVAILYVVTGWLNIELYAVGFEFFSRHTNNTIASVVAFVIAQGIATVLNFIVQRVFIFKR